MCEYPSVSIRNQKSKQLTDYLKEKKQWRAIQKPCPISFIFSVISLASGEHAIWYESAFPVLFA